MKENMINVTKGKVIAEFEKVCPSDRSLQRIIKEMHNLFDELEKALANK